MNENLTISINGKCTLKDSFDEANKRVKDMGKANKDAGEAGKKVFGELSKVIDSQFTASISKGFGVVNEMAKGGVWGAMASVASIAITAVVDKLKEMKERAVEVSKAISEGIVGAAAAAAARFNEMAGAADNAMKAANATLANRNGVVDSEKEQEIQKLRYEAYQKCLDAATEEGRKLIEAEAAMRIAFVERNAAEEKAKNQVEAATAVAEETARKREAAEANVRAALDAQRDATSRRNSLDGETQALIAQYNALKARQNTSVEALVRGGMEYGEALKAQREGAEQLVAFEKEHAELIKEHGGLIKTLQESGAKVRDAENALSAAELAEEKAATDLANAKRAAETAAIAGRMATEKASNELAAAEAAAAEAVNAARQKTEDEAAAKAALAEEAELNLYLTKRENDVKEAAIKLGLDGEEVYARFLEYVDESADEMEAYNKAVADTRESMKKLGEKADEATEDLKNGKGGKDGKDGPKMDLTVSLNNASTDGIGASAEKNLSFKDFKRQQREAQRKQRDIASKVKTNQADMAKYLKGDMPQKDAEAFKKWAAGDLDERQRKMLANYAAKSILVSPKGREWQRMQRNFDEIQKLAAKDPVKEKISKNVEQVSKDIKNALGVR